jgi:hypothetical protein
MSGSSWDFYRQALAVEFQPTLYPANPDPKEPAPPNTDACGTLTPDEQAALKAAAEQAFGQ